MSKQRGSRSGSGQRGTADGIENQGQLRRVGTINLSTQKGKPLTGRDSRGGSGSGRDRKRPNDVAKIDEQQSAHEKEEEPSPENLRYGD